MGAAAVGTGLLAVLVGTLVLGDVNGPRGAAPPRPLLTGHVVCALAGVALLGVGAAIGSAAVVWIAAFLVAAAGLLGVMALARTLRRAVREGTLAPSLGLLIVHGAAALATLVLGILAAARA
jgi:hypothetical protein